jgi:hypothetical protein
VRLATLIIPNRQCRATIFATPAGNPATATSTSHSGGKESLNLLFFLFSKTAVLAAVKTVAGRFLSRSREPFGRIWRDGRLPGEVERLPGEMERLPSNLRAAPNILVAVLAEVSVEALVRLRIKVQRIDEDLALHSASVVNLDSVGANVLAVGS